jgi:hypothetical protein
MYQEKKKEEKTKDEKLKIITAIYFDPIDNRQLQI